MRAENKGGFTAVGLSSVLTIFAVLCLVVFTLLTLSTVLAARSLSDSAADYTLGYYNAELEAETTLAQLRSGTMPEGVRQAGGVFCYDCPISDTQTLAVEVAVEGSSYTILRWQAVSTAQWTADESLPVWDGQSEEE